MPVVDLYGRNPDVEATAFSYPYPLVWNMPRIPPAGAVYFFKPPESNPVIGVEPDTVPNAEDTVAILDPTNVYNQRMYGLGSYAPDWNKGFGRGLPPTGTGIDAPGSSVVGSAISNLRDAFVQDKSVREGKRAETRSWASDATSDMGAFYKKSSGTTQTVMLVIAALVGWNVLKRVGK